MVVETRSRNSPVKLGSTMEILHLSANSTDGAGAQSPNQRAFTESDETKLLKTYLKVVSDKAFSPSPTATTTIVVTSSDMEDIEASLRHRFSHNQIIDKLRRLRLKYHRHARSKSLINTPHDHKLFFLSRKIWSKQFAKATPDSPKRQPELQKRRGEGFEALKEEMGRVLSRNGAWRNGLECLGVEERKAMNKEWILLWSEETELVARKTELVNESARLLLMALTGSSS